MKQLCCLFSLFLVFSYGAVAQEFQFKAEDIEIPYKKYTLKNGLTLLVHEDHKARG